MKKLLIASAIAMAVSAAHAQNAQVYGVLDTSQYYVDSKNATNYVGFNGRTTTTSRFGIRVSEDLGGGLSTGANIETELNPGTGAIGSTSTGTAAGTFNRAANVFLTSKSLGTLTLGRQTAPVWAAAVATGDALGINSLGFTNAVAASAGNTNTITGETRAAVTGVVETSPGLINTGIGYRSPSIGGLTLSAFTAPGTGTQGRSITDAGQRDIVASYRAGALNVAIGQTKTFAATGEDFATRNLYAANYTIGALKITGGLHQTRYDTLRDIDVKSLGARYQITAKTAVGASWTVAEDKTVSANKNTIYGVAGFYDLSKRTQAYGLYGKTKNEGAAYMNAIWGGPTLAAASEAHAFAVGVRHSF